MSGVIRRRILGSVGAAGSKRAASHVSPLTMSWLLGAAKQMSHVPNYEEKYRAKLQQRAREQGCATIAELKQNLATGSTPRATPPAESKASGKQESTPPKKSPSNLPPTVKSLDQIMRLDLLMERAGPKIGELWTSYHAGKPGVVSAAIPADTYRRLQETAKANPLFVLPLPRADQGVEFFLLQFDYHQVHFTSLAEYKVHTVQSRPVLTLTHYTDLMDCGIVLMRGELDPENRTFDVENAQLLALLMQLFYVSGGPQKRALLETFNHRPAEFDYAQLIEAAQTL
ncbi:hypothetical protein GGI18_000068 [Coemansia linderi]|uniref:Uncharacterized protein n=1 Tax=Coemansia linderi TaxID=2663919 RepID=A0ACC1KNZ9_9FUNG|nr:hypothetical protein GGI18_000068 [Coemansia linderi]